MGKVLMRRRGELCSSLALTLALILLGALAASGDALGSTSAPGAGTSRASLVTYSSAVVHGRVKPHGLATEYAFQYGTTTGYGGQTPLAPAGSGNGRVRVHQSITGLLPATRYHYRILAVSTGGLTYGKDRTFKTDAMPLSLHIAGVPNPVVYGSPFLLKGTLSGTKAANREVILEANPYPYSAGFHAVGNRELTDGAGAFSFPYPGLRENAQLRVRTAAGKVVSSPVILERVAVRVSFHARRTHRRGYVRLYGMVAPAEPGARVGFQLVRHRRPSVNKGGTRVKAATPAFSRFSRVVRIRHPGRYRALVVISDGAHVYGRSSPIRVR
jgi:hypothetical protein